jgi:uncharacterized peroxidase-related enzyme
MSARLSVIDPSTATGSAKEILDKTKSAMGMVPNMVRLMANAPVVAEVFLSTFATLGKGVLDGKQREAIALAVAQQNSCGYCLSAHTAIGKMNGMTDAQISGARNGTSGDATLDALVKLSRQLVDKKGHVTDADLSAARQAGLSDAHIAEAVANVAFGFFTNYFNHVAQPVIDFPTVSV